MIFVKQPNYYRLQWSCPCESHYEILDLGAHSYPRYLSTATCASKPCHNKFNQCKLIHYKVYVLRHRDINDSNDTSEEQFIEQPMLPEPFRVKWHLKPIITTVACVSASEGRMN
ncbi:hypothetical protein HCN44_000248 [Aphidius gifuensis]|uniref:Uncharacterized protein n=1 Tax=Aphidius gifuensis TaxID=684658 RepID=A0A834XPX8_APHGI|nr:hypothetical protein HCN44_000248 [Aphidius gifuensis]